ncbi:MAG: hypothetical protein KC561_21540, partial [Myxococcales bacterium]|nr:hypothetical protein [Myxococcales bacterium]
RLSDFEGEQPEIDFDSLLDATVTLYQSQERGSLRVTGGDPAFSDFVEGIQMTVFTQTSEFGAPSPMSRYTRTWLRDNVGSLLANLWLGRQRQAIAQIDYLWGGLCWAGDFKNNFPADLEFVSPWPPDWDSLGPLETRVGAETPSYVVIMHGLIAAYAGELDRLAERWPMLRRAMFDLRFDDDYRLPFTGDETFRTALSAATGLPLAHAYEDEEYSLNSQLLWLAAERQF